MGFLRFQSSSSLNTMSSPLPMYILNVWMIVNIYLRSNRLFAHIFSWVKQVGQFEVTMHMLPFNFFFNSTTYHQLKLLKQMNESILYGAKCLSMKSKWIYLKQLLAYLCLFPSYSMLIKYNIPRKQHNEPNKQTCVKLFMDLQKDSLFVIYLINDHLIFIS